MSMLGSALNQQVTHWGTSSDGFGGYAFTPPTVLDGRWEERSEIIETATGETIVSKAIVFLGLDVDISDYLFLGSTAEVNPTTLDKAFIVKDFQKIPDLAAVDFVRRAIL